MSLGNRFAALVLVFLPLSVQAADARSLGSTYAVLDALRQNQGDVVLAFIDSLLISQVPCEIFRDY